LIFPSLDYKNELTDVPVTGLVYSSVAFELAGVDPPKASPLF
jgi:hypothetical protein